MHTGKGRRKARAPTQKKHHPSAFFISYLSCVYIHPAHLGFGLSILAPFFLLPPSLFLHGQTLTDRCKARTVALLPSRFARDSPFVHSFARRNGRLFMDFHRSYHHPRTLATPPAPWFVRFDGTPNPSSSTSAQPSEKWLELC